MSVWTEVRGTVSTRLLDRVSIKKTLEDIGISRENDCFLSTIVTSDDGNIIKMDFELNCCWDGFEIKNKLDKMFEEFKRLNIRFELDVLAKYTG